MRLAAREVLVKALEYSESGLESSLRRGSQFALLSIEA